MAFTDPIANEVLCLGLAELENASASSVRSFVVRTNRGGSPVIAHLVPTPGRARDLFDGALGVLMLTPVKDVTAPDAALIRGLFDLTPNEARAAQGVAKGWTVDQIAQRHGVGRETIRSQVKAVLAKTGAREKLRRCCKACLGFPWWFGKRGELITDLSERAERNSFASPCRVKQGRGGRRIVHMLVFSTERWLLLEQAGNTSRGFATETIGG